MTKTIYVGNLPWSTTEESLAEAFNQFGPVQSCRIVTDRETGRSRGFGFVEVNDEDSERIITAAQGLTLGGRVLTVNEARERGPRRF
ncbi:MAG: RNA recognition motif domain-containing protein [Chloroflexota bacterium]